MPDGSLLYQHQLGLLHTACPEAPVLYVSLAKESPTDLSLRSGSVQSVNRNLEILYDLEANETGRSAGPAAGLLAAYRSNPDMTWLVLACDYPLMTSGALMQLKSSYTAPVTCFRNADGFCEPLVGIWSPQALAQLAESHATGRSGPSSVVRELGGLMLVPESTMVLWNVNTEEDWGTALERLR